MPLSRWFATTKLNKLQKRKPVSLCQKTRRIKKNKEKFRTHLLQWLRQTKTIGDLQLDSTVTLVVDGNLLWRGSLPYLTYGDLSRCHAIVSFRITVTSSPFPCSWPQRPRNMFLSLCPCAKLATKTLPHLPTWKWVFWKPTLKVWSRLQQPRFRLRFSYQFSMSWTQSRPVIRPPAVSKIGKH